MRIKYFGYILNSEGQPIGGASVSILKAGTDTPVYVFISESGGSPIIATPQVTTKSDGYYEFWIADEEDVNYGYPYSQKIKVSWFKSGVTEGYVDYISVFPYIKAVDEADSTTSSLALIKNKSVSNRLAYLWTQHKNADVITTGDSTLTHGIEPVDETDSTDTDKNKLVSNAMMENILTQLSGEAAKKYEEEINSWTDNGEIAGNDITYYSKTVTHSLGADFPVVQFYDVSLSGSVDLPWESNDSNSIVVYSVDNTKTINVKVIG